jgi:Holliday junction resolvasome RuvABC endonuclease subunit
VLVLGVDVGTTKINPTGYALVNIQSDTVLRYGLIAPDDEGVSRVADLSHQFDLLLLEMLPTAHISYVAIEAAHVQRNVKTGLLLARMAGAYEAIAAQHGLPVRDIQPSQGKAALAYGGAGKEQVQNAVKQRYGLVLPSHIADAIGIALASVSWADDDRA